MKNSLFLIFFCFFQKIVFAQSQEPINFKTEITKEEWAFFFQRIPPWHEKLWKEQMTQGHQLKDWHWTYRLAWLRICSISPFSDCPQIFHEGLIDKGVAIRTQAANYLAKIYVGTSKSWVLEALQTSYQKPEHRCLTKPNQACLRLLFAMKEVGLDEKLIKKLADNNEKTKNYFLKL